MFQIGNIHLAITFDKFSNFTNRKWKWMKLVSQTSVYTILIKHIPLHRKRAFLPFFYWCWRPLTHTTVLEVEWEFSCKQQLTTVNKVFYKVSSIILKKNARQSFGVGGGGGVVLHFLLYLNVLNTVKWITMSLSQPVHLFSTHTLSIFHFFFEASIRKKIFWNV